MGGDLRGGWRGWVCGAGHGRSTSWEDRFEKREGEGLLGGLGMVVACGRGCERMFEEVETS